MDIKQNQFLDNSEFVVSQEKEGMRIVLHRTEDIINVLTQVKLISIGPLDSMCMFNTYIYIYDHDTESVNRYSPDPLSSHYHLYLNMSLQDATIEIMKNKDSIYLSTNDSELENKFNFLENKK